MPSDDIHFPQCHNCPSERVKRNKSKQVLSCDLNVNKKQKTRIKINSLKHKKDKTLTICTISLL